MRDDVKQKTSPLPSQATTTDAGPKARPTPKFSATRLTWTGNSIARWTSWSVSDDRQGRSCARSPQPPVEKRRIGLLAKQNQEVDYRYCSHLASFASSSVDKTPRLFPANLHAQSAFSVSQRTRTCRGQRFSYVSEEPGMSLPKKVFESRACKPEQRC
jgi:hypothetical protein